MNVFDKIWAAILAILTGNSLIECLFNHEEKPWAWISMLIYFLFFLMAIYQIKTQQSVLSGYLAYRKCRKAWREDPNNWSV